MVRGREGEDVLFVIRFYRPSTEDWISLVKGEKGGWKKKGKLAIDRFASTPRGRDLDTMSIATPVPMTAAIPIAGKWNDVSKETSNSWIRTRWFRGMETRQPTFPPWTFQIYLPTPFLKLNFELKWNTSWNTRFSIELNRIKNSTNDWLKLTGSAQAIEVWGRCITREPWRELGQGCQSMARTSPSATNVYVLDRPFAAAAWLRNDRNTEDKQLLKSLFIPRIPFASPFRTYLQRGRIVFVQVVHKRDPTPSLKNWLFKNVNAS